MREKLVRMDVLEAVIALGHNLFYNSAMISCVLVCRARKDIIHKGKVIFIDAENDVTRKNAQSFLSVEQINKILKAYYGFVDVEGFARVVDNNEILESGSVLSISYYVEGIDGDIPDYDESIEDWKASSIRLIDEYNTLKTMLEQ